MHELAHIKRGDLIAHGLYMLLQIVYWYNPLLWLVRRQVHHLRELSCDATVAELLREQTMAYRQTLLETARRLLTSSVEPGLGLLGLFEDSNRLLVRLDWLTKPTWRYRTMKRVTVATIAALMLACVLPMAQAQETVSHQPSPEVVKHDDQSAQEIAALQARLEELMAQQQQLQEQLRALTEQRSQIGGGGPAKIKHAPAPAGVQVHVQKKIEKGDVTVVPWQNADPTNPDARKLRDAQKAEQAKQEHFRAMDEKKMAEMEAQRAQVEAQRAKVEALRAEAEAQRSEVDAKRQEEFAKQFQKRGEQMQDWQANLEKWEDSEEMQRWQEEMEQWGRGDGAMGPGDRASPRTESCGKFVRRVRDPEAGSVPAMPAMPAMPTMPVMPAMPEMPPVSVNVHVPGVSPSPHPVPHVEDACSACGACEPAGRERAGTGCPVWRSPR